MASSPSSQAPSGPPYAPQTAGLGGFPTVSVDVPICSVFLLLFIGGAIGHMTIFQLNRRKHHKFIMSALMFGFCMARIVANILRISWATRQHNIRLAIAAQIFVAAGVLILFLINLIFAQRIFRATHPHFGWHVALSRVFMILYISIVLMLVMVITATVDSFYTLNMRTRKIDRDLQITAGAYLMFIAFLPIPMVILGLVVPRKTRLDKFGSGRFRSKIYILLAAAVLLTLGAAFRVGTTIKTPRPASDPAWYDAKWCFYLFDFTIDITVVYLYLIVRVDRRFHVPDHSQKHGDYSGRNLDEQSSDRPTSQSRGQLTRIMSEEEVFDDSKPRIDSDDNEAEAGGQPSEKASPV